MPDSDLDKQNDNENIALSSTTLDRFVQSFELSAKRWELIVYPSLFAFVILASYGFFLIYHLTSDVATLARNVSALTDSVNIMTKHMNVVANNMNMMSVNMNYMSKDMNSISVKIDTMSNDMSGISTKMNSLLVMEKSMVSMDKNIFKLTGHTDQLRYSVQNMDNGVQKATGPMRIMNGFMPW
jgi:hypothetical protein